jgi:hypothetical protein
MKTKFFAFSLILIFAASGFSQTATVTPRTVVHRRANTSADYKKKYTVVYPKISSVSRRLKQKIERNLKYEKTFNFYFTNGLDEQYHLLDKGYYRVIYNKNDILNLRFSIDVSTAYKSHYDKTIAVNLKTGELIRPEDVFISAKQEQLAAKINKFLRAEIDVASRRVKKEFDGDTSGQILAQFKEKIFTPLHLDNFELSNKGITFVYTYDFAYFAGNYKPRGRFFLSYAQLKPFVRRDGLFGKFIK